MTQDTHPPHIAVLDDEPRLRRTVANYLARRGCRVTDVPNAAELRDLVRNQRVDLVVLDADMPGEDPVLILQWLRSRAPMGIVVLVSRDETGTRLTGLELAADDHVVKPIEPRELLARVRALLRRMGYSASLDTVPDPLGPEFADVAIQAPRPVPTVVRVGSSRFDLSNGNAWDASGRPLDLTRNERQLLSVLVSRAHEAVSHEALLDAMPERSAGSADDVVDDCVASLRQKIESDPELPRSIVALHKRGYMYTPHEALRLNVVHHPN